MNQELINIHNHFKHLCNDKIIKYGELNPNHSIDFKVFRILCVCNELIERVESLESALKFYADEDKVFVEDRILETVYHRPATKALYGE